MPDFDNDDPMPDLAGNHADDITPGCFPSLGEACGECHRCNPRPLYDPKQDDEYFQRVSNSLQAFVSDDPMPEPDKASAVGLTEDQLKRFNELDRVVTGLEAEQSHTVPGVITGPNLEDEPIELRSDRVILIPETPKVTMGRNDEFHTWLKRHRDQHQKNSYNYYMIDTLCDLYTLHCDTGTPLDQDLEGMDDQHG